MPDFADRACEKMRGMNAELAELTGKCNHEDTKTRKVRWLSSCLRAFVVAFNNIENFSAAFAVSALNVTRSKSRKASPDGRPTPAEQNDEDRRRGQVRCRAGVGGVAHVAQPAVHLVDCLTPGGRADAARRECGARPLRHVRRDGCSTSTGHV